MKRLILVRHGKSSWKYDVPDDQRPLKKRAYKDAKVVLNTFKVFFKQNIDEVCLWTSYATRAKETAILFKEGLDISDKDFEIKEELYTFDKRALKTIIKNTPETIENLMIFSHNPGLTGLANLLGDKNFGNIPTTGLVVVEFSQNQWQTISEGKTLLTLFPKNIR
ncbi:SixA phosphatase family protein [Zunongwangia sp.]|uniref:SixA phosphatase family protein n=1 Tax=Zunongwangia sp. TaxID=1965325 RepID=UPI003AA9B979